MLINTAVFGPIDVDPQSFFFLPDGLYGFNGIQSYALIEKQEDSSTYMWFQAVDQQIPCFVVFDPFEIFEGFKPSLEPSDFKALGCSLEDLRYLVIAVVPEDITKTTINLKSPIVLNMRDRIARQVILANKEYPIKFALVEEDDTTMTAAKG